MPKQSWRTPLTHEVRMKNGRTFKTLADVRTYMLALPEGRAMRQYWQHGAELLLEASQTGHTAAVTRQLKLALLHDGVLDLATPSARD